MSSSKRKTPRLEDLEPAPYNPRDIDAGALAALKTSLGEFGDISGITWNRRTGHLVTGHQRLRSLQEEYGDELRMRRGVISAGDQTFRVRVVDWPLDKERAANIAANSPLLAGFFTEDIAQLIADVQASAPELAGELLLTELLEALGMAPSVDVEEDEIPDPPAKAVSQPGDLWILGDHRAVCGDARNLDVIHVAVDGGPVSLTCTSFPYAVRLEYASYEDTIDNLRELLSVVPRNIEAVTEPGGFCVVNFGDIVSARGFLETKEVCEYPMALEYWPAFRDLGWYLHTRRVWVKPIGATVCPWTASSSRGSTEWEHVWTWKLPGPDTSQRSATSQFGVWHYSKFTYETDVLERHPGAFPVYLPAAAISIYTEAGDAVMDTFIGSGSTLIAAEQLGRRAFGCELEPRYCDVIVERWQNLTGKKARRKKGVVA